MEVEIHGVGDDLDLGGGDFEVRGFGVGEFVQEEFEVGGRGRERRRERGTEEVAEFGERGYHKNYYILFVHI